ncbi:hypothetical protein BKA70DRAFT_1435386 [Coprinopsis sp. MPI-PUGE-AT-0042]|nr:hypothetical protein BKA70DRAFT_1435386 [Coprinopsis sp. MPI-PUGE-AT-0042]
MSASVPKNRGRRFNYMSDAQMTIANQSVEVYVNFIASLPFGTNAERMSSERLVSAKKKELVQELLDHDEFKDSIVEGDPDRCRRAWVYVIGRKFNNKKFNVTTASASLRTQTSPPAQVAHAAQAPLAALDDADFAAARRAFIMLKGEFSARKLFIHDNAPAIAAEIEQMKANGTQYTGGALWNAAVARLWTNDKKEEYAGKVDPTSQDIQANQQVFAPMISKAIGDLLKRGLLGTALAKLSFAVRNPSGGLDTAICYIGYDAAKKEPILYSPSEFEAQEQSEEWQDEANYIIPRVKPPPPELPTDSNGLPMWPHIDLEQSTVSQVSDIVQCYIDAVWEYAIPRCVAWPCFPAEMIAADPSLFIDTAVFKVPAPLPPKKSAQNFILAEYFEEASRAGRPFRFRSKDEIEFLQKKDEDISKAAGEEFDLCNAWEVPAIDSGEAVGTTAGCAQALEATGVKDVQLDHMRSALPPPPAPSATTPVIPTINGASVAASQGRDPPPVKQPGLNNSSSVPPVHANHDTVRGPTIPAKEAPLDDDLLDTLVDAAISTAPIHNNDADPNVAPPVRQSSPPPLDSHEHVQAPNNTLDLLKVSGQTFTPPPAPTIIATLRCQTRSASLNVEEDRASSAVKENELALSEGQANGTKKRKTKRPGYYWECKETGDSVEDDELPDSARPAKRQRVSTSLGNKENATATVARPQRSTTTRARSSAKGARKR